jgi:CRP-like cAMP-binding protein/CheY-like chemotaxis protein
MKTILLIEDSVDIRETTAEILELAGYEVVTAENGKIGVELAQKARPDIVVCDIMMPVLDGYGVLHIFNQNENLRTIPFILLTAKTERADLRKGMEMGADDFLTKPFQEIELLNAIESRLKKLENLKNQKENTSAELEQFFTKAAENAELKDLILNKKVAKIKKKQIVYAEGDEPLKFYFLQAGKIKAYKLNDDGKEYIVDLYGPGDFFGHLAILEDGEYNESAEAMEACEIIGIPARDFKELISRNHKVAQDFIKLLANNIHEKENKLSQMAYNSLRKRVAEALVLLSKKFKGEASELSMKIPRDDLAAMVGTATESLIRILSEFKQDKFLEISAGEIKILNLKRLENLKA